MSIAAKCDLEKLKNNLRNLSTGDVCVSVFMRFRVVYVSVYVCVYNMQHIYVMHTRVCISGDKSGLNVYIFISTLGKSIF